MLALERVARVERRGGWANRGAEPGWRVRAAADLSLTEHGFRIVRGRVLQVEARRHYIYLNFGADWRTDFTIRVRKSDLAPAFQDAGLDVLALAGRRVEVRGLVLPAGGPLVELSHPEQIEVLP